MQIHIVGVAYEDAESAVRSMVAEYELTFPNLYDPDGVVPVAYEADVTMPHYVFLDKKGRIAERINGAPRDVQVIKNILVELRTE